MEATNCPGKLHTNCELLMCAAQSSSFACAFPVQCLILMHWCEKPFQKDVPNALKGLRGKPLDDLLDLRKQVRQAVAMTERDLCPVMHLGLF